MSDRGDASYKTIGGQTIRVHTRTSLERLELRALIAHAQLLKTLIGIGRIERTIPDQRDEILLWILRHQTLLDAAASPGVGGRSAAVSPTKSDMVDLANAEMSADGLSRGHQTKKFILAEEHSRHAQQLARRNPPMAAAILREINDGIQRFHDGIYGGDLWLSQRKIAEDIYKEFNRDKDGSFFPYRNKFLNISVVIGNIGFSGNIPCFRYKVAYPEKWSHVFESAWVSVFFTLKEVELQMLLGNTASPYGDKADAAVAAEAAYNPPPPNVYNPPPDPLLKAEIKLLEDEIAIDEALYRRQHTRKYIVAESHSKHAQALARNNPLLADCIIDEIDAGIQKFHDGIYGGDLFMAERKLAEDIDKELHRDKENSLLPFREKFLNFSVLVGNMAYDGDIPCFRYKVLYPKKWTHRFPGDIYETAYVSVFFTLKEQEWNRLAKGLSA